MTQSTWKRVLFLFEKNQEAILDMEPGEPALTAKYCRESAHRTLGHLTACQAAWLSLMRQLRDGAASGSVPIHPDPLFRKLGFGTTPWDELVERFVSDRAEWRSILERVDLNRPITTPRRTYSAQSLTKRMVEHEMRHLDDLTSNERP
jgi:uncharacterized damage-inducible protein DinB